jgi:hypothetical protein
LPSRALGGPARVGRRVGWRQRGFGFRQVGDDLRVHFGGRVAAVLVAFLGLLDFLHHQRHVAEHPHEVKVHEGPQELGLSHVAGLEVFVHFDALAAVNHHVGAVDAPVAVVPAGRQVRVGGAQVKLIELVLVGDRARKRGKRVVGRQFGHDEEFAVLPVQLQGAVGPAQGIGQVGGRLVKGGRTGFGNGPEVEKFVPAGRGEAQPGAKNKNVCLFHGDQG